jgi:hypothetical protein
MLPELAAPDAAEAKVNEVVLGTVTMACQPFQPETPEFSM